MIECRNWYLIYCSCYWKKTREKIIIIRSVFSVNIVFRAAGKLSIVLCYKLLSTHVMHMSNYLFIHHISNYINLWTWTMNAIFQKFHSIELLSNFITVVNEVMFPFSALYSFIPSITFKVSSCVLLSDSLQNNQV